MARKTTPKFKTLLKVDLKEGIVEDHFFERYAFVYNPDVYDFVYDEKTKSKKAVRKGEKSK